MNENKTMFRYNILVTQGSVSVKETQFPIEIMGGKEYVMYENSAVPLERVKIGEFENITKEENCHNETSFCYRTFEKKEMTELKRLIVFETRSLLFDEMQKLANKQLAMAQLNVNLIRLPYSFI